MAKNYFEEALKYWSQGVKKGESGGWYQKLDSGALNLAHYKGYLLETFHNTGFNPQIQGFAQFFMPSEYREVISRYLKHAASEVGHDLMALEDLKNLGVSDKFVKSTSPLPITLAFNSYPVAQLLKGNIFAHLGYMFHLEFLPTQRGKFIMEKLRDAGIPHKAMSFLEEHVTVDVVHNKFLQEYLDALVQNDQDFEKLKFSLDVCGSLHTQVVGEALARGENLFGETKLKKVA